MQRRRSRAVVDYLFVYGSLRPALKHPLQRELQRHATWVGAASWRGQLYDLGRYPAAVQVSYPYRQVQGDLFQLRHADLLLRRLDCYEGIRAGLGEYRRVVTEVQRGEAVLAAWIYLYSRAISGKKCILSGDYLEYVGIDSSLSDQRR